MRSLRLQQAAEASKRQSAARGLLGGRVRERAPLLKKQDLEHRQRRIAGAPVAEPIDRRQQRLERQPVERLLDPVQKSSDLPVALAIASSNEG